MDLCLEVRAHTSTSICSNRHPQPVPLLFFGGGDESLEDGSKYNPAVISFIRDEWISGQMQAREAEYTQYRPLRLFVGTWNVNGKWPREDISAWLTDGADADGGANMPDLYVVGLQEMVDLTATNVALQTQCGKRTKDWCGLVETVLNNACSKDTYECLGSRYLVGVMISVFVKRRYRAAVGEVQDATAAVGVMGMMGNKGAAAIRLRVFDSTFCFICAHLAAHRNAVAQRNADFASIMSKIEFKEDDRAEAAAVATKAGVAGAQEAGLGSTGVLDHDVVIWFGDFNYRIVESVAVGKCFELACGGDAELEVLRRADQLNMERAAGRSFHGFQEGPLTFRPTYKFQPGTPYYEQRPEKKLRAPAWCDRILWRTGAGIAPNHFAQLYYGSVDGLLSSDHKPVHALFEVAAKTTVREARNAVATDIARQLDSMENSAMPKLHLSDTGVHLHDVVYQVPSKRTITLKNPGAVAATWRFVPKPEDKVYGKTWLTVQPAYGMLAPGGSATLELTVTVDDAVARDISLGRELAMSTFAVGSLPSANGVTVEPATAGGLLEDILILRVERGRDFYLPVTASVLPTAFGCSLAQLARRPEPMRAIALTGAATAAVNAASGAGPMAAAVAASQPQQPGQPGKPPAHAHDLSAGSRAVAGMLAQDEADVGDADAVKGDGSGGAVMAPALPSSDSSRKGTAVMAVPKEIWRLVDVLVTRGGLDARGIFTAPGEPGQVALLRECLDTGDPIPGGIEPRAVAHCLLDLLSSLREPVIPCPLFPGVAVDARHIAASPEGYTGHVLRSLSPLHANVLVYICRLGREILSRQAANGVGAEDLAFTLSRALMRKVAHDEAPAHMPAGDEDEAAAAAASASAAAAAQAGRDAAGGDDNEGLAGGSGVSFVSLYADKGTRWEPSREEQEAMGKIMGYLLTRAPLG